MWVIFIIKVMYLSSNKLIIKSVLLSWLANYIFFENTAARHNIDPSSYIHRTIPSGISWDRLVPISSLHEGKAGNTLWTGRQYITGHRHHSLFHSHLGVIWSLQSILMQVSGLWTKPEYADKTYAHWEHANSIYTQQTTSKWPFCCEATTQS